MASTTATVPVGLAGNKMTNDDQEGRMISLAGGGEEEERTCVGRSTGRPSIVPASDDHCHRLLGWRLDDQRRPREEEDDDFVGPGGGADEATAAPRSGTDGTASNRTVDEADEGAGRICSYVDVQERHRAREELLRQAERTRAILDSVLVGIVTVGAGDNQVRLLPPLTVTEDEIDEAAAAIDAACSAVAAQLSPAS